MSTIDSGHVTVILACCLICTLFLPLSLPPPLICIIRKVWRLWEEVAAELRDRRRSSSYNHRSTSHGNGNSNSNGGQPVSLDDASR